MKYGSVCSGIEAATAICAKCKARKPLSDFHKQPSGKNGRHCYCKDCFNALYRGKKRKPVAQDLRRKQNLAARYRLTQSDINNLLMTQGGRCSICGNELEKFHVDHNHITGKVRGLLCHRCNIIIGGLDDPLFRAKAVAYLEQT